MKLFNKQRFQVIKGSRLRKYLTYAIGEVLLVVIGILIALGINNWQTEQADENELDRIIEVVKIDLQKDLIEANTILESSKTSYKLISKILYDGKFQDSIRDCKDCRYIMTQARISDFNSKGFELLSNFNKEVKNSSKYVDTLLNFYTEYKLELFNFQNRVVLDEVVENMKYLRNNYSWFSDYYVAGQCNDDCKDYFESSDYINRLTYYEAIFFDNYLYQIEQYKISTERVLEFLNSKNETI